MDQVQRYGSQIGRRMRAQIMATVEKSLGLRGETAPNEPLSRTKDYLEFRVRHVHGHNVIVTVVRADKEACAATVRFNGAKDSRGGDREPIRLINRNGTWQRDRTLSLGWSSLIHLESRRLAAA